MVTMCNPGCLIDSFVLGDVFRIVEVEISFDPNFETGGKAAVNVPPHRFIRILSWNCRGLARHPRYK